MCYVNHIKGVKKVKNGVYKPVKIIAREVLRDIGYDEKKLENMSDEDCENELTEIYKAE